MRIFILLAAFFSAYVCFGANLWGPIKARETLVVGNKSTAIDVSALLELYSTTAGFLPPAMTTAQRDNIGTPATFLIIGNSTTGFLQIYDGANWVNIGVGGFTANRALKTDASGNIIVSTVTDAELEYISGLSSAVQTQLNAKAPLTLTTNGDTLYYNAGYQRLAKGTDDQVMTLASGIPVWSDAAVGADGESVAAVNYLKEYNPGFEKGDATSWTNAGSGSFSVQNTTVGEGSWSGQWDAAADGDTLTQAAATVPDFLKKNNSVFCFRYKGGDANQRFIVNDGSNDFIDETLAVHADWTDTCINRVMPDVASVIIRLEADADAAEIFVDTFFMGDANRVNISNISQAEFYGAVKWESTASCLWFGSTGAWTSFDADSDCTTPAGSNIEGKASAPATKIPAIAFANMDSGRYVFKAVSNFGVGGAVTDARAGFRFYDGSTELKGVNGVRNYDSDTQTLSGHSPIVVGEITYDTAQSNKTFEIQYYALGGTASIDAGNVSPSELYISVYRFPTSSQTAYTPGTKMQYSGVKIAAHVDHSFSTTSATYAKATDPDIIAGDKTHFGSAVITATAGDFGFKMPTIQPGKSYLYANITMRGQHITTSTNCQWGISDDSGSSAEAEGSNNTSVDALYAHNSFLGGYVNYDSVQTDKEITVYSKRRVGGGECRIHAWYAQAEIGIIPVGESVNMPQILNNVESSASGGVKMVTADLNCDAGSAITSQDGSAVSSIGNISSGVCAVALAAGTFSVTPRCSCDIAGSTLDTNSRADATSTTNVNLYGIKPSDGSALTSFDCDLICIGSK